MRDLHAAIYVDGATLPCLATHLRTLTRLHAYDRVRRLTLVATPDVPATAAFARGVEVETARVEAVPATMTRCLEHYTLALADSKLRPADYLVIVSPLALWVNSRLLDSLEGDVVIPCLAGAPHDICLAIRGSCVHSMRLPGAPVSPVSVVDLAPHVHMLGHAAQLVDTVLQGDVIAMRPNLWDTRESLVTCTAGNHGVVTACWHMKLDPAQRA